MKNFKRDELRATSKNRKDMGSKKKKAEKKKDFQKAKLKVGKSKLKPNNHTDTSFVSKTISLPNQSLASSARGTSAASDADLLKRLSLCKHHAPTTRKETLIYFGNHLPEKPTIYKNLLNAVMPLMLDDSKDVRTALVDLLGKIAARQPNIIELHTRTIVLFVNSAMTHIIPGIKNDAVKFVNVLVMNGADVLVRSSWVKLLKGYFAVLGWNLSEDKNSVSLQINTSSVNINSNMKKIRHIQLESLIQFLRAGCIDVVEEETFTTQIHPLTDKYLMASFPQPYAYLKVFAREIVDAQKDIDSIACEDFVTRRKVFVENFSDKVGKNLENLIKDGGDAGRSANTLQGLLAEIREKYDADCGTNEA